MFTACQHVLPTDEPAWPKHVQGILILHLGFILPNTLCIVLTVLMNYYKTVWCMTYQFKTFNKLVYEICT